MSSLVGGPSLVGGLGPGPPAVPLNPALVLAEGRQQLTLTLTSLASCGIYGARHQDNMHCIRRIGLAMRERLESSESRACV